MADEPVQPPNLTTLSLAETAPAEHRVEQKITPFEVSGGVDKDGKLLGIDYDKLIRSFGATPITPALLERFEKVTRTRPHRFMRRGIVFSHRELEKILDRYEKGQPFYLYTGRGPSSDSMHVGHSVPFEFTKFLQEAFDCPLVIMLTDDEKFMHSKAVKSPAEAKKYARENAKDIIGIGFDPARTFIFSDFRYISSCEAFYDNICMMAKRTTLNQIKGTFGFDDSNNIGEFFFPAIQSATSFATSFPHIFGDDDLKARTIPCLIPCAIDQDPYFRQCRDNAEAMKYKKPSLIHSIFLPALQGPGSKMSASVESSAIFLNDTPKQIKTKINKYAFSGGQDTEAKHRELGGRTKDDVAFQYLTFFLEDDEELADIKQKYESGELLTGHLKARCITELQEYVAAFQERRKLVTEEVRELFMSTRPLTYGGNPNPVKEEVKSTEAKKEKPTAAKKEKQSRESKVLGTLKEPKQEAVIDENKVVEQPKELGAASAKLDEGNAEALGKAKPTNGHARNPSKRMSKSGNPL